MAWSKLSKYTGILQKGKLVNIEGIVRYREAGSEQHGKQRFPEVHATSLRRLSQVEAADDLTLQCRRQPVKAGGRRVPF